LVSTGRSAAERGADCSIGSSAVAYILSLNSNKSSSSSFPMGFLRDKFKIKTKATSATEV
jgi:hypothetical protein